MFDFLTQEDQKRLKQEYKMRRLNVFLVSLIVVEVIFLATLFPSYIFSVIENRDAVRELEELKVTGVPEDTALISEKIEDINRKVELLKPALANVFVHKFIKELVEENSGGIELRGISYSRTSPENFNMSLTGLAPTRESLVSFVERLEQREDFSNVDLPVSNLAHSSNINFSLQITGNFNE